MEILAIIPARGGSKGLPGKNIRPLLGYPLISYSILAAQKVPLISRVIVSTDDEEIASVSTRYGADIPTLRPAEYAQDFSSDFEVFDHMLRWLKGNENYKPDYVVQLRPTSPVRKVEHITASIEKLTRSGCDSLRIVTEAPVTPYKMWTINNFDEPMIPLIEQDEIFEPFNQARQQLPKKYWQIGYLDVIRYDTIVEKRSMTGKNILPYYVDKEFAIDIDTLGDFAVAELYMENNECIKFA
ncbi:MAG: acylneuraminate cytidylyltransferase family protein [Chitinophagaceae bacterium]|nr:acylneuraminate cytidylyltransferase family protein [Chitinophagaceae bacterium]